MSRNQGIETKSVPLSIGGVEIEKRADGTESRTIKGRGVVFNTWSDAAGWYEERIAPSAFEGVDFSDVIATFNHDMNNVMARTTNTLELTLSDEGLDFRFEAPKTTAGNDLLENVRNGNVTGSSFMFTVKDEKWVDETDHLPQRTITQVGRLIEIGPVTLPFYKTTTAKGMQVEESEARDIFNSYKAKHDSQADEVRRKIEHFKYI